MTAPEALIDARIVTSAEASRLPPVLLGGKASNLVKLCRAALPVPPWFCVTSNVFTGFAAGASMLLADFDRSDPADRAAQRLAARKIGEQIRAMRLAQTDHTALLRRFDEAFSREAFVAVRSSAVGEDSAKDSFAGQMDTYLFVTRDTLAERVIACFASAFSERALLYRRIRRGEIGSVQAAVIIQLMVEPRASGVLFTANPSSGALDEMVVSAGYGLGEGVVSGLVETDTYFLDGETSAIRERAITEKRSQILFDRSAGAGTCTSPVRPEISAAPVLADGELAALAALGHTVADLYGVPQDIEWSIDLSGNLHLLQARPITTLVEGCQTILDNSNVVESYPGLSSPLTFSYARAGYFETFHSVLQHLGIAEETLAKYAARHRNLVALVNGRIYYNLLNWYGMFEIGGLEWMLPAWERALGLPRRYTRRRPRPRAARAAALKVKLRLLWQFFFIKRQVGKFLEHFERIQVHYRSHDLTTMEPHALLDLHDYLAREIRPRYYVSVMNDAFTQQLFAWLGKLITRFQLGDPDGLSNELLCGESGMQSVEPVRSGLELAEYIRSDERLSELFGSALPPGGVWDTLAADPAFAEFRRRLAVHLTLYGDRTLHELKLETPPAEENPAFVVSILRNYLRGGQTVASLEREEREIRGRAESAVEEKLSGHPLRGWILHAVLRRVRAGTRDRENLRLARCRAFGWSKRIYRAMAARFVERGLLDNSSDIFYLTDEEIAGAVLGHSVTRDLRALTAMRQREYESYREQRLEGRIITYGIVAGQVLRQAVPASPTGNEQVLRGQGCAPGRATAKAKVVLDPAGDLDVNGEILIAPMTDPGWVFLMVASKGLVSEKGSVLSHTAIVGRELGIPTVVGVKDATTLISSGDTIEIDGEAGTVRLLGDQSSECQ